MRTDSTLIPLDSIAAVRVLELNKGATLMLLAAAATTALVVVAQGESEVRPAPQPRPTSCPFIYSFDGKSYVFDSETYAGAIARGLERTDVDNLDHLRAVDGTYRLRFTNERPETHYTDKLALLIADHPAGTRALPDAAGDVHLVGAEAPATGVKEFGGDTIPSRAGWELAFRRPPGDSAALVLHTRNSAVAPFVIHTVLSLLGSDVYAWYASIRDDFMTRAIVRGWIDSEGALDVQLFRDGSWRSVGRLPDVGPAIAKTNVVMLDLRGVRDDTLRLRLESSPGLWMLERARVAMYAGRAETREIRPVRAIDERGQDVADLLSARDSRYLVTTRGSNVAIEFDAPALPAGSERSILARTTGHYYVHTDDRPEPRKEIVLRLMADRKDGARCAATAPPPPATTESWWRA